MVWVNIFLCSFLISSMANITVIVYDRIYVQGNFAEVIMILLISSFSLLPILSLAVDKLWVDMFSLSALNVFKVK